MFWHVFSYRIRTGLRDRQLMFWTLLFPVILATLFNFAFANLNADEPFEAIPTAVVTNEAWDQDPMLQQVMNDLSTGPDALFVLSKLTQPAADQELQEGRIAGYYIPGQNLELVVRGSGLQQSILKVFADEYLQTQSALRRMWTQNPDFNPSALLAQEPVSYLQDHPASSANPDNRLIYFYALIAMACLFGGYWGLREIVAVKANLSSQAARVNLSPIPKMRQFLYGIAAAMLIQFASIVLVLVYLRLVPGVDFGDRIGYVLLASLVGSILGVSIGAMIGAISNLSEGIKSAQLTGFTMLMSFFAGLMMADMKYIVTSNAPILAWLNPANLISDAFYSLYYYESFNRYWNNIAAMLIYLVVCGLIVFLKLRRQRYASI